MIASVCLALVLATIVGSGASTFGGRLGGDFPAFYAAGRMVIEGSGGVLYDAGVQTEFQTDLFLEPERYLYFAYPSFTAVAYAALATLPFRIAFMVHGLASVAALWGTVRLSAPLLPSLLQSRRREVAAVAALLAMYPFFRAVLGGQNTAFTLLLLAGVWRFAADERPALAGLALAALLYKPQYGLLLLLLVVVARRWKIVAWWALGALFAYLVGAAVSGLGWPAAWLDQLGAFSDEALLVNGYLFVSAIGWFRNLLGTAVAWPTAVGLLFAATLGGATALWWWRRGINSRSIALAATAIVIASPSAVYYDAGLAAGALGVGADRGWLGGVGVAAAFVVASWTQPLAETIGWSPLFPILLAVFAWSAVAVYRSSTSREAA